MCGEVSEYLAGFHLRPEAPPPNLTGVRTGPRLLPPESAHPGAPHPSPLLPRSQSGLTCWVRSWKAREMTCLCSLLRLVSTSTMAWRSTPEPRRGLG